MKKTRGFASGFCTVVVGGKNLDKRKKENAIQTPEVYWLSKSKGI